MSPVLAGVLQLLALVAALALAYVPLGNHLAKVYSSSTHLRVEKWIYKGIGADPDTEMRWPAYLRGVLAFSLAGVLFLYLLQRLQGVLPGSLGFASIDPDQAFNTAASFVANTNWQSYYGEQAMGHVVQTAGLAVQNFVSAAVGIAVAVALVRGFARSRTGDLGNFWADLVRGVVRVLVPLAVVGAVILVACGVIQNFSGIHEVGQFTGGPQQWNGGAVASQEVIKELGTNGGGYFNANSAHPFENPTPFTNLFEIFLILVIPVALTRTFGVMVGSVRQGYAILGTMATVWVGFVALMMWTEFAHHGPALQAAGGAMEGKEVRFGIGGSSIFAVCDHPHLDAAPWTPSDSSFTGLGGGITMLGMMLGEIAPGGVGSGLYGMLVMAVIAASIAGLMVGRTPEYLGKKIGSREIKFAACYILITPALVLTFTAAATALPTPGDSMTNSGARRLLRDPVRLHLEPPTTAPTIRGPERRHPAGSTTTLAPGHAASAVSCPWCSSWRWRASASPWQKPVPATKAAGNMVDTRLQPDQAHRDRRDRQAVVDHARGAHDVLHRQRRRQVLRDHPGPVRGRPPGPGQAQHHGPVLPVLRDPVRGDLQRADHRGAGPARPEGRALPAL
ncbi:Potassium-transporting ATPase potassium-binding subunit [Streptomyces violaceorubidus]